MKAISFLFVLLLTLNTSRLYAETYNLQMDEQKVKVEFFSIDKVLVNDICKEKLKTCKALNVYKGSTVFPKKLNRGILSSPAQAYCLHLKGVPLKLTDDKGAQIAVCAFDDMTMISSWDLFNSHVPRSKK